MSQSQSSTTSSATTPTSEQPGTSGTATPSTATSSHCAGTPGPGQSVSQYLESICVNGALAINDRDFDYSANSLYTCVSPNFRAHFEDFPHPLTLQEHSNILRQTVEAFPAYHVEVQNVSSEVKEERAEATVYMETEVTGAPEGVKTFLINEFKLKKLDGGWRCVGHHGMKGIGDHSRMHDQF
ncbi:putative NTF2-like domain superfamily protein [Septoria linicola]|nr:putative NTF2-like domain superfamily protein [Septoria linicola]